MIFEQIPVPGDRNFAYIVGDEKTKAAALVDPGMGGEIVIARIKELDLDLKYVINTHLHSDHNHDNKMVADAFGAKIAAYGTFEVPLKDGDVLELGEVKLEILHTPGHTDADICILAGDKLITGDTLFVGKVGGTDFGAGARAEFESLHRLLDTLDDSVEVWPGHDVGVRPSSTIGDERRENPFLVRTDFDDFLWLKKNWAEYKKEHGID